MLEAIACSGCTNYAFVEGSDSKHPYLCSCVVK